MLRKKSFLVLVAGLLFSAVTFVPVSVQAVAQQPIPSISNLDNTWAWSNNVGWISLGSSTAPTPYRVAFDGSGVASGYAWSNNLGWLRFDPTLSGPVGNDNFYSARFNGNNFVGWARFCSVYASGCSGALKDTTTTGGWDGWLKMINVAYNTATNKLEGFSWGSLVSGWTKFGVSNTTSPLDVYCVGEKSTDGNTVVWAARAINGSGAFNYSWSGSGSLTDDSFGPIVAPDVLATSTYTKAYTSSPARTVSSSVTVSQGKWSKTCNASATVGGGGCTTNCGGHSFSARCEVSPATVAVGAATNWTSSYSYGSPATYLWSGYRVSGSIFTETNDPSLHPLVGAYTQDVSNVRFNTAGNYAGRVTMVSTGGDKAVSDYCSANASRKYVTVNGGCTINLTVTDTAGFGYVSKTGGSTYQHNATAYPISVSCGTHNFKSYNNNNTLRSINWTGCDTSGASANSCEVTVPSGTKNVTANFDGGNFDFSIFGGRVDGKFITWNNPGTYPSPNNVGNKDYVKIRSTSNQPVTIDSADFDSFDSRIELLPAGCASPVLMIGDAYSVVNYPYTYDTANPKKILVRFPDKCVNNATGQSIFYRAGAYSVNLQARSGNGSTGVLTFKVNFNDSAKSVPSSLY